MASKITFRNGALCITGNWPGSRCFPVVEGQRPPLWRLASSLGMNGDSTLAELRAALANKSWNGRRWVDDAEADLSIRADDEARSVELLDGTTGSNG